MDKTETKDKKGHKVVKYLTHTEALNAIDTARALKTRKQFSGNLIALAMQLQYYAGLRVSELTAVTPRDIKLEDSRLDILVRGKGNKQRVVPIVNESLIATINYINNDGRLTKPLIRRKDVSKNIDVAKRHSKEKDVSVNYKKCLPEDVVKDGKTYDVVISFEVIEHVRNAEGFVETCCELLKTEFNNWPHFQEILDFLWN